MEHLRARISPCHLAGCCLFIVTATPERNSQERARQGVWTSCLKFICRDLIAKYHLWKWGIFEQRCVVQIKERELKDKSGNPSQSSRRKLIKALLGTGAAIGSASLLPQRWTRPVISAIVLPAHAQLSPPPAAPAVYSIECGTFVLSYVSPGVYNVNFTYTPVDSSGVLNGQVVATTYVITDQNNTTLFGPNTLPGTQFGVEAGPAVNVNNPVGFIRVTITFADQGTYGTDSCIQQDVLPPTPG